MLSVENRVSNGVKLLDEKIPNWREKIITENLYMHSITQCILGQLGNGSFLEGLKRVGLPDDDDKLHTLYGFDRDFENELSYEAAYEELNEEWKNQI